MPTHKDFPDSYLRARPDRLGRAGRGASRVILAALLLSVVGAGYFGASKVLPGTQTTPRRSAADSHVAPEGVSRSRTRARPAAGSSRHASPRSAPATPRPATVPAPRRATAPKVVRARPIIVATGLSLPGTGEAPQLTATAYSKDVAITSRSPMPLHISVSAGFGERFRLWATLRRGGQITRIVATGRRYAYCFSQTAGGGYAATRACGALTMHQSLNGVRLPDGPAVQTIISFTAR